MTIKEKIQEMRDTLVVATASTYEEEVVDLAGKLLKELNELERMIDG